jgi:hypothetical protein
MRKFIYSILMAVALGGFYGCDNSASSTGDEPAPNGPGPTMSGLTCLEAKGARLPSGTYAKRVSTGEKAYLDANGCFSLPKKVAVAGRMLAAGDSVQFYNDSALFSVTIPYQSQGDTINIVPTVVSLMNCPTAKVDSVFLVVFDRIHIMSRRVKMKRADLPGSLSEFGRTIWSVESSNPFKIHFEVHDSTTWPSAIITSEPGGTVSMNYSQLLKENALTIMVPDTVFFFTEKAERCMDTVHAITAGVDYVDTCVYMDSAAITERVAVYKAGMSLWAKALSSYGVAEVKIGGMKTSTYTVAASSIDPSAVAPTPKVVDISVIDSAGYTKKKTITVFSSKYFYGVVSDSVKAPIVEYVMYDEKYADFTDYRGGEYHVKVYGYKKK